MTVGQARLARPEPSECFDSPGIGACGESAERGSRRRSALQRRSVGRGRRGDEPAPDPRELPAAEPQSSQAARAAAAASSRLSVSFTSRPTDSGAGAEKQADHRQPPDLPTPESAAQPDSPQRLRAPKIQRREAPQGCVTGSRGGSRGALGRAHPQLTALTTRTLPRIKHAVEPNLAVGPGSGGQRLGDGLAGQSCSIESRVGPK